MRPPQKSSDKTGLPSDPADLARIQNSEDRSAELKRLRELVAQNRDARLRLQKNLAKVSRQIQRTHGRTKIALASTKPVANSLHPEPHVQTQFSLLAETFNALEPRNGSARKCIERLVIRCRIIEQQTDPAQRIAQFESLRFEYALLRTTQGDDSMQAGQYTIIDQILAAFE